MELSRRVFGGFVAGMVAGFYVKPSYSTPTNVRPFWFESVKKSFPIEPVDVNTTGGITQFLETRIADPQNRQYSIGVLEKFVSDGKEEIDEESIVESFSDILVVNYPLPDEFDEVGLSLLMCTIRINCNNIAIGTRRSPGNRFYLANDHLLIWYHNSMLDTGAKIVRNNLVVNTNHLRYYRLLKFNREITESEKTMLDIKIKNLMYFDSYPKAGL